MRFSVLDGWRGLCALLVAVFHGRTLYLSHLNGVPLVEHAFLLVDFFFVLSGFVLAHAYAGRLAGSGQAGVFVVRRFGRLWPLHVLILLLFIVLEVVKLVVAQLGMGVGQIPPFGEGRELWMAVPHILLVHALGLTNIPSWNEPSWSIGAEFCTYLLFAGIMMLVSSQRWRCVLVFLIAAGGAMVLVGYSDRGMDVSYDYGFFRCIYGFFCGYLTYEIYRQLAGGWGRRGWQSHFLEGFAVVVMIGFVSAAGKGALGLMAPLLFALVVLVFAEGRGVVSKVLLAAPFQALGRWSYSIYMVHALVIAVLRMFTALAVEKVPGISKVSLGAEGGSVYLVGSLGMTDVVVGVYLVTVVAVAAFTYRWVEVPGQKWFNQRYASACSTTQVSVNRDKST